MSAATAGPVATGRERIAADRANLPELDGLRAIAITLVVFLHACEVASRTTHGKQLKLLEEWRPVWDLGRSGVQLFFVLSAFLLFRPYAVELLGGSAAPSTRSYAARRARRIVPAYWAALAILTWIVLPLRDEHVALNDLAMHVAFVHNWSWATDGTINPVFWTMAIEAQFYVLLPVAAALLVWIARRRSPRASMLVLASLALVGSPLVVGGLAVLERVAPSMADHRPMFNVLRFSSVFGMGMVAALMHVHLTAEPDERAHWLARLWAFGGVALLALLVALRAADIDAASAYSFPWMTAVGFSGLLVGVVHVWPRLRHMLSRAPLVFIAAISYSLYLWHVPIYSYVAEPIIERAGGAWAIPLLAVVTAGLLVPAAWLSYRLFERPFHRRRAVA